MKYKINPRGIIKWVPFAAINNPEGDAHELNRINNIQTMPELSPDQIAELNRSLLDAFEQKQEVFLSLYNGESFQTIDGLIEKIDVIESHLVIAGEKIQLKNIVEMM